MPRTGRTEIGDDMAVLTRAALRAAISTVFASGKRITAEQARGWFGDAVDSLLDAGSVQGGAGISVDRHAGVVTLSTGGAQASVGLPIFFGGATYSAGNDRITLSGVTAPPRPSIIYCIAPVDLDRSAEDLNMMVDGVEYQLVDVVAGNVAARLLTPAGLVGVLWRSGEARLLEIMEPRPQDFDIVVSWLPAPTPNVGIEQPDFEAYVDGAFAGESATATVTLPAYPGTDGRTRVGRVMGVPEDAPPFLVTTAAPNQPRLAVEATRVSAWDGWRYMGDPFIWFSLGSTTGLTDPRDFTAEFQPYP